MPFENFPQWSGCTQVCATTMILETNQCTAIPTDRYISDAAWYTRSLMDSPGIEHSKTAHIGTAGRTVILCKQLVSAANRKYGHIVFNCRPETNTFDVIQILSNGDLFFVLASPNKQHVILVRRYGVTDSQANGAQLNAAMLTALA